MPRANSTSHSPTEILELIQSQLLELRQTESLEAQIHEMVVSKRHRLDALMSEFLEVATQQITPAAQQPQAQSLPHSSMYSSLQAAAHTPSPAPALPPEPLPPPVQAIPVSSPSVSRVRVVEDLPLTQFTPMGSPKDLLAHAAEPSAQKPQTQHPPHQFTTPSPNMAPNANPSAQQVLDSLNRLMSGLKEISGRQQ